MDDRQLERLAAFEAALAEMADGYDRIAAQLEEMRAQGKTKTATYQQLAARKLALRTSLAFFEDRGLR